MHSFSKTKRSFMTILTLSSSLFCNSTTVDFRKSIKTATDNSKISNAKVAVLRSSVEELSKSAFETTIIGSPTVKAMKQNDRSCDVAIKVEIGWSQSWIAKLKERLDLVGENIGNKRSLYLLNDYAPTTLARWDNGTYVPGDTLSKSIVSFSTCKETKSCINWSDKNARERAYRFLGNSCGGLPNYDGLKSIFPNSWAISTETFQMSRMDVAAEVLSNDMGRDRDWKPNHFLAMENLSFFLSIEMLDDSGQIVYSKEIAIDPHLALSRNSRGEISGNVLVILSDARNAIDLSISVPEEIMSKISKINVESHIKSEVLEIPQYYQRG